MPATTAAASATPMTRPRFSASCRYGAITSCMGFSSAMSIVAWLEARWVAVARYSSPPIVMLAGVLRSDSCPPNSALCSAGSVEAAIRCTPAASERNATCTPTRSRSSRARRSSTAKPSAMRPISSGASTGEMNTCQAPDDATTMRALPVSPSALTFGADARRMVDQRGGDGGPVARGYRLPQAIVGGQHGHGVGELPLAVFQQPLRHVRARHQLLVGLLPHGRGRARQRREQRHGLGADHETYQQYEKPVAKAQHGLRFNGTGKILVRSRFRGDL